VVLSAPVRLVVIGEAEVDVAGGRVGIHEAPPPARNVRRQPVLHLA